MTLLEQRLRDALAAEAALWPVPADEWSSDRRRRGWVVAAGTAAAMLILVAGVVFALGSGRAGDAELGGDAPVQPPPIEVGPFEQVAGADGEFSVDPLSEEPGERGLVIAVATVTAAASGQPGLVAVGSIEGPQGGIGAIWHSSDGDSWVRIPHDDAMFGDRAEAATTAIFDVEANDTGYIAVGARFAAEERTQLVWLSQDGITWTRSEVPDLFASAVVGTDAGWTVVGGGGLVGSVWNSTDGLTWTASQADTFQSDTHNISLEDVAYNGQRFVVVGGTSARDFREERPVIWTSADGTAWERVVANGSVFDIPTAEGITAVASGPNGFVAVGQERLAEGENPGFGAVWFSPDGLEWERTRIGDDETGMPAWITSSDAGYVLGGFRIHDTGFSTQLWTSTDGMSWDAVEPEGVEPHFPGTVLLADRRVFVFGAQRRDTGSAFDTPGYGPGAVWAAEL